VPDNATLASGGNDNRLPIPELVSEFCEMTERRSIIATVCSSSCGDGQRVCVNFVAAGVPLWHRALLAHD
jgi:hypothetical protein